MGQVYRATDTKLKRQVAIKILPPSLAADADRLARFQREAEVLASLNHPNIAAIYGLEESGHLLRRLRRFWHLEGIGCWRSASRRHHTRTRPGGGGPTGAGTPG